MGTARQNNKLYRRLRTVYCLLTACKFSDFDREIESGQLLFGDVLEIFKAACHQVNNMSLFSYVYAESEKDRQAKKEKAKKEIEQMEQQIKHLMIFYRVDGTTEEQKQYYYDEARRIAEKVKEMREKLDKD